MENAANLGLFAVHKIVSEYAKRIFAYMEKTPRDTKLCMSQLIKIKILNFFNSFYLHYSIWWIKPKNLLTLLSLYTAWFRRVLYRWKDDCGEKHRYWFFFTESQLFRSGYIVFWSLKILGPWKIFLKIGGIVEKCKTGLIIQLVIHLLCNESVCSSNLAIYI